jgi:hypothetical protein
MKKLIAVCLVCLFAAFGCAALKADFAKVETGIESIDWDQAIVYWQKFVQFANEAIPVLNVLLKNDSNTLAKVTNVVADANTAVTALATTVAAYKAGNLSETEVVNAAQTVQTKVVDAVNQVAAVRGATASAVPTAAPASAAK